VADRIHAVEGVEHGGGVTDITDAEVDVVGDV
jgi:hypothetical protein